ncbi:dynamin family protein [Paenibacillus filicis]|uniref:Dynamin family protein n=1 Tax=Paenibacillus gyeongsangnamensis TaxID=3388067 RepID=A0ABT4Q7Z1_9BACL|nr:dynamin family protein [Paenibacillus filicis]MCZ8512996.1 dynamin family protein [Paenibacillus filicis]
MNITALTGERNKETPAGDSAMTEAVGRLLRQAEQEGDYEHARKFRQLLDKARSGHLYLAFCGHFSAGKSSLINRLCGHPLLPSSPIPTSANIVSIVNGESGARVIYRSTEPGGEERSERVPLDALAEHCRNGEDIETVEISYPIPFLGEHGALLDTPGIDSTDDAHQLATESALHLADVVFYVMDYNHVQSEINLAFAKKMIEWGKPLYLIINMVDKHRERELSFESYREGVREAFANWHVEPSGILYTSVKRPDDPNSEWPKLDWLLHELIGMQASLTRLSLEKSARALAAAHAAKIAERGEPAKEALRARLAGDDGLEEAQVLAAQTEAELARLESLPLTLRDAARREVGAVLENANVIPAVTRDLAHVYLEARRPGFKAGLFAGAAKTAKEIERRLEAFRDDFAAQAETQVARHVQQTVKQAFAGQGLAAAEVTAAADRIHAEVTPEWLAAQVNPSAGFGGEYTLNYSKLIAAELKAQYRKEAFAAADGLAEALAAALAPRREALRAELAALGERLRGLHELEQLAQADAAYAAAQLAQLPPAGAVPALPDPAAAGPLAPAQAAAPGEAAAAPAPFAPGAPRAAAAAAPPLAGGGHRRRLREAAARLDAAAQELAGVAALQTIRRSLREKADRLANNRFTVALFGAFSAGKSSFANALIGERVLPVSPNPTTAAINKILPPEPEQGWPHGTAKVKVKTREQLSGDVLYSLEVLNQPAPDLEQGLRTIRGLRAEQVSGKGKPHYSFLKAVERGWDAMEPSLGRELSVDLEGFASYAADETRSCFVDGIELYYHNPLTEQGVVLVDTPGADSINARHTGVAFDYIKNADAILFVTYYNHAFSHADKEFLLQLGRVKDSFEMDKMFFIVNAADLASSAEELEGVVKHVESNLLQHGIRHPRIYPLSSYYGLEAKLQDDPEQLALTGMLRFEQEFVRFTFEELTEIAIRSGDGDIKRAADVLDRWMEGAQADASERQRQAAQLREALGYGRSLLHQPNPEAEARELEKEIRELLYYVKQRTSYRFGELYNLAFNPSVFREEGRDTKSLLQSAWEDLLRMLAFDLSQEVLATTLRIENKINKLAGQAAEQWTEQIRERIPTFEPEGFKPVKLQTPKLQDTLQADEITVKWIQGFYKNAKQFFEGEGKQALRRELEIKLNGPMTRFADLQTAALESAYARQLADTYASAAERLQQELAEHGEGLLHALEASIDLEALRSKRQKLLSFIG